MRKHKWGRPALPPKERLKMTEIRVLVPADDFRLLETDYENHPNFGEWPEISPDKLIYGDSCDILMCRKCGQFWVPWLPAASENPPSNDYYYCPRGCNSK